MGLDENLDLILEEVKPLLDNICEQLPDKYKDLSERSFSNVVDLAKQLALAKIAGDEEKVERTKESLQHSVTALLSTIISGIVVLENPVRKEVSEIALKVLGLLLTAFFSLVK